MRFFKKILTNKVTSLYFPYHTSGGMAEWFNAAVLKTAVPQGTQSSNLCPSAIYHRRLSHFEAVFCCKTAPYADKVAEIRISVPPP